MGLSADNLAILERSIARAGALVESDSSLRSAQPSLETFRHVIDCRTSIEIVQRIMETYGDRPAIGYRKHEIVVDGATGRRSARFLPALETISYRALWERIELLSSGLQQGGMARTGDIVSLVGFSTVDHVVAELACHHLAAASVPFAKNVTAGELEAIVNECESTALFCSLEQLLPVARSMEGCPSVRTLVVIDLASEDDSHREAVERARALLGASRPDLALTTIADVEAMGARAGRVPPVIPAAGTDPLLSLVYTSGSTGTPKGAMFTERSWHARWSTLPFLELAALPMVSVVFLPQNHMGGRNAIANSLKLGGLACLTHGSDMSTLFEDIRLVRPTYLHLVPRLSELIYQHFQSEVARRGRAGGEVAVEVMAEMRRSFLGDRMLLALTASAPTPPEVSAFIRRCFDIPIVDVFAGTEYGQILVDGRVNRHNVLDFKLVSVPELGYLDTDEPYPRGELYVKTARGISSYFRNEAATRELFDPEGFMRTGDIFERRGPDELVWIDRKNNVQKIAQGEFVNIWKLEALFATASRLVKQVYIQGNSARSYLLAVIVPELAEVEAEIAAGAAARETAGRGTEAAIKSILRAELHRLASAHGLQPYEIPRDFLVETEPFSRDNGLLTSLGKPSRPKLKARYGPAIDRLYEALDREASALTSLSQDRTLPVAVRVQRTIAAILGLAEDALDASRSFRSFGGDSIAATNLCALLQRDHGVRLSVSFVLGPETAIADLCREVEARLDGRDPAAASAFERIHGPSPDVIRAQDLRLERFYKDVMKRPAEVPAGPAARAVLLTGATGFLGRFLCLELLEHAARTAGTVYCLVRARSDAEAAGRLAEVYRPGSALHARFAALAHGRLHVLAGDLEQPRLGLADDRYRALADAADTVVHAAALVNHALPYAALFDANVLGTAEVMRLALAGRPKRFNFTSTNSVSLALLGDRERALESDDTRALGDGWPAGAARHANGYQLSKWAGEVLTQDLFETFGIPVNVFRCNLILPPARAREQIHADDFLIRLVCSVVDTGLYPGSFYERGADAARPHLDGFPVDFMAAAIAAIATGPLRGHAVYHVNNVHWDDGVSLDTVMGRLLAAGYPLTRVDDHATWFARFERALRELPAARQAASSLPILDQWRAPLAMDRRRRIDAARFRARVQSLRPHGAGDIPHLDDAYFDRCIEDLRRLGLLGDPPRP